MRTVHTTRPGIAVLAPALLNATAVNDRCAPAAGCRLRPDARSRHGPHVRVVQLQEFLEAPVEIDRHPFVYRMLRHRPSPHPSSAHQLRPAGRSERGTWLPQPVRSARSTQRQSRRRLRNRLPVQVGPCLSQFWQSLECRLGLLEITRWRWDLNSKFGLLRPATTRKFAAIPMNSHHTDVSDTR